MDVGGFKWIMAKSMNCCEILRRSGTTKPWPNLVTLAKIQTWITNYHNKMKTFALLADEHTLLPLTDPSLRLYWIFLRKVSQNLNYNLRKVSQMLFASLQLNFSGTQPWKTLEISHLFVDHHSQPVVWIPKNIVSGTPVSDPPNP